MSRLRTLRKKTGEGMNAFALRIGMEPALLSWIERGKRPCKRNALRIAKGLNVDPRQVWEDFDTFRKW